MNAHSQSIIINNIEEPAIRQAHCKNSTLNTSLYLPWGQYINHSKPILGVRRSKTVTKLPHDFSLIVKSLGFQHKKEPRFANKMLKGILIKNKSVTHSKNPSEQICNRSFEGANTKLYTTEGVLEKYARSNTTTLSNPLMKATQYRVLPIHSQHNSMSRTIYKSSTKKLRDHIVKIAMSDINPKRRLLNYIIKVKHGELNRFAKPHKYIALLNN